MQLAAASLLETRFTIQAQIREREAGEKAALELMAAARERSLEESELQSKGAIRMPPDHVAERARELGLKQEAWLIAYCA